jgi:hypothetical protein
MALYESGFEGFSIRVSVVIIFSLMARRTVNEMVTDDRPMAIDQL